MTHTPDLPLIHGALVTRGIPCHIATDEHGYPIAVTATHLTTGATIECRWVNGAYEITFPCGMVTATARTTASATSVAGEVAWQYDCYTRLAQDEHETAGGYWTMTADGRRWVSDDETACRADSYYQD